MGFVNTMPKLPDIGPKMIIQRAFFAAIDYPQKARHGEIFTL